MPKKCSFYTKKGIKSRFLQFDKKEKENYVDNQDIILLFMYG